MSCLNSEMFENVRLALHERVPIEICDESVDSDVTLYYMRDMYVIWVACIPRDAVCLPLESQWGCTFSLEFNYLTPKVLASSVVPNASISLGRHGYDS